MSNINSKLVQCEIDKDISSTFNKSNKSLKDFAASNTLDITGFDKLDISDIDLINSTSTISRSRSVELNNNSKLTQNGIIKLVEGKSNKFDDQFGINLLDYMRDMRKKRKIK